MLVYFLENKKQFVELSTKNFNEASKIKGKDDFCFIIGKQEVHCHLFVAAFLSRKVNRILLSDPTASAFHINVNTEIKETKYEEDLTRLLVSLINGEKIEISDEIEREMETISDSSNQNDLKNTLIYSYLKFFNELENDELKHQFYKFLFSCMIKASPQNQENDQNYKEQIDQKLKQIESIEKVQQLIEKADNSKHSKEENIRSIVETYFNEDYMTFISEIASHFFEIDDDHILRMNSHFLSDILNSNELRIKDEDSLLKVLLRRRSQILSGEDEREDENENEFFIEKVEFEYLSEESVVQFIREVGFDQIDEGIWRSVCRRLLLPSQKKPAGGRRCGKVSPTFSFDESNPFGGIMRRLSDETGGNIYTNKTVEITCSKFCCGKFEQIVNYSGNDTKGFVHVDGGVKPRWLQIDFKERRIRIDSYLIQSSTGHNHYLKSWRVEISENGSQWEIVDEHNEAEDLNGGGKMKLFNVEMTKPFRYVRIVSEKQNWYNDDGFDFGKIEFFGEMIA